jgi:hypothetical protein
MSGMIYIERGRREVRKVAQKRVGERKELH